MDRDVWHADIPNRCRSIRYFDRQADRDGDSGKLPLPINARLLRQLLSGMKDWASVRLLRQGVTWLGERRMTRKMSFNDYIFLRVG